MPGGLGDSAPGRHGSSQDVLPQLGQPVPEIQRQPSRLARIHAGLQAGAEFGGGELQHLWGAVPTQLASSFRAGQGSLGRRLAVGMVSDQCAASSSCWHSSPKTRRRARATNDSVVAASGVVADSDQSACSSNILSY